MQQPADVAGHEDAATLPSPYPSAPFITPRPEKSTAELAGDFARQLSTLVHEEIELAKSELAQKGKKAGLGAGFFGGAGIVGILGLGALIASAIAALHMVLSVWLSALIVGILVEGMAAVFLLAGKAESQRATPLVPQQAMDSTKEDLQWLKTQARSARG
jgi:Putative Actinobacterial Holin-X, holin superfamily III